MKRKKHGDNAVLFITLYHSASTKHSTGLTIISNELSRSKRGYQQGIK
jgi:hypothetical protein